MARSLGGLTTPLFDRLIEKYRPRGVRLRWKKKGWRNSHASLRGRDLLSPRPDCRVSLYVFLHECAHFHLKHHHPDDAGSNHSFRLAYTGNHRLTLAHQEYEAERWVIDTMRKEGLRVPQAMVKVAKEYVRDCLTEITTWEYDSPTPNFVIRWCGGTR